MSAPVFISYSSKDQTTAETICKSLESRGQTCWISCRDVHPGENFQEAIVHAMRAARVMVLVFTSNANNSDEIKKELVLAGRHHVTVVPVRVEDVLPSDAFSYELATRQWIDLFKNWEQELERLSTRIASILQTAPPQESAGAAPAAASKPIIIKRSSKRPLVWVGAAIFALLLIGAGGVALYLQPFGQSPASAAAADNSAWDAAQAQGTPDAFTAYLKAFPQGGHANQAQLRIDSLTLAAISTRTTNFDGTWDTTMTCQAGNGFTGYIYKFSSEIKDGQYHGQQGTDGKPGWFTLDGRIGPDGTAALIGRGVIASSATAPGNAPIGTPFAYGISAQFQSAAGVGKRNEGRACSLTFVKN